MNNSRHFSRLYISLERKIKRSSYLSFINQITNLINDNININNVIFFKNLLGETLLHVAVKFKSHSVALYKTNQMIF